MRETKRMSANEEEKKEPSCVVDNYWLYLEQPVETGTLRLQRHLQLKQTGVMQDQTLLLFKMETAKRHLARDRRGIMGSQGEKSSFTAKSNGEIFLLYFGLG